MREADFAVTVIEGPVNPFKAWLGVPRELASCHTALVGGYVVEGHVPAVAIKRLLAERPKATGLSVPGMLVESSGMEPVTYQVVLFGLAGRETFASYQGANLV